MEENQNEEINPNDPLMTSKQISKLFNLTPTRLAALAKMGVIPKEARGKYPTYAATTAYIKYLQTRKLNQWGHGGGDDENEEKSEYKRENIRRVKEQADALELSNAQKRGELIEVEKVRILGEKIMAGIKVKITNSKLNESEKDKILADLFALKDKDWSLEEKTND